MIRAICQAQRCAVSTPPAATRSLRRPWCSVLGGQGPPCSDRYAGDVQCVLAWVLGIDGELPDLLHDVFLTAFDHAGELHDASRLRPWLISIAVFTARERIRRRARRSWLLSWGLPPAQPPCDTGTAVERDLIRSTRAALGPARTRGAHRADAAVHGGVRVGGTG